MSSITVIIDSIQVASTSPSIMAHLWTRVEGVIELAVTVAIILTAGILGVFALGLCFRRATARGLCVGITVCVLFSGWATLTRVPLPGMDAPVLDLGSYNYTLSPYLIGILGNVIVVVVGGASSTMLGGPPPHSKGLTLWDR